MKKADLDLYTDYLLSTFGAATATGLSAMVNGDVSHDRITRFLSVQDYTSSSGRTVKGINLLNALYYCNGTSIPVAFELVKKPIQYSDLAIRKLQRKSKKTKNEMMREMIETCIQNALKFRYVLMDSWFSSEAKFEFITEKGRHFMAALKDNRLIALSEDDRKRKRFVRVNELNFPDKTPVQGWLKGYAQAVPMVRQVFKSKDDSTGILHLVCSDLTCDYDAIVTSYKKRWQVEVFHKFLKSNANLAKSPTRTLRTQSTHVFMAIYATFKLECLGIANKLNPSALCRKLLINASRTAYAQLQLFRAAA